MSVILVTGGTGVLGVHLVHRLRQDGHSVRVLSRRPGAGTHVGDLISGQGVAEALAGAEIVIHAASDTPSGRSDRQQTRTLLRAAGGVAHLVYVSIAGIDAVPYRYYARKLTCEEQVAGASVPSTIVRATQFHELLDMGLSMASRLPVAPLPLDWRLQPVAATEVAGALARVASGPPMGRAPDFGGPEVLGLSEIVEAWRARHGRPRRLLNLRLPGRAARAVRDGMLTVPARAAGQRTWRGHLEAARVQTRQDAAMLDASQPPQ